MCEICLDLQRVICDEAQLPQLGNKMHEKYYRNERGVTTSTRILGGKEVREGEIRPMVSDSRESI